MTPTFRFSRSLAATLGVAMVAGCATSPLTMSARTTTATPTAHATKTTQTTTAAPVAVATAAPVATAVQATAFADPAAALAVTPTTVVLGEAEARAVAATDEAMIEGISAGLEADEATAVAEGGYRVAAVAAPVAGVKTVLAVRQARAAVQAATWGQAQQALLAERRARTLAAQADFERTHPAHAAEATAMREAIAQAPWRPNAADATTIRRTTEQVQRGAGGQTRRVVLERVVGQAAPHFLVSARVELAETAADGTTKAIRWEKTRQADGSCHVVYHHEHTGPDGTLWVTDWEKAMSPDGRLSGGGSFKRCDRMGRPLREDVVVIGGDDRTGQRVRCIQVPAASPSPTSTPTPTPSPSPSVSAEPTAAPTAEPTATPTATPTPLAVCRTGSVTGGGQLAGTTYSFGFGPQVITINDVSGAGAELKADVLDTIFDGTTATVTGRLRAPRTGLVTLIVTDNGEGGNDPDDTVTFLTGAGVTASGPLARAQGGGNVQVHSDCE